MRDVMSDARARDALGLDIDLAAEPMCCPGGACGPIFEKPLLELAFNRIRDFVRGRNAAAVAQGTADPPITQLGAPAPAIDPQQLRSRKDAPHG